MEEPGTRAAEYPGGPRRSRLNPALSVVVGVLVATVAMTFGAVSIAVRHADPRLPEQYHWEGWQVDRDFELSKRSSELRVRATIDVPLLDRSATPPAAATCRVRVSLAGTAPPTVTLDIVHAARPELDQHLRLKQTAASVYEAPCKPVASAPWRLELADDARSWSVRSRVVGPLAQVAIAARDSESGT